MGISSGIVSRLCKHNKLIEKIFSARMLMQPFDSFSEIEIFDYSPAFTKTLFSKDSDINTSESLSFFKSEC